MNEFAGRNLGQVWLGLQHIVPHLPQVLAQNDLTGPSRHRLECGVDVNDVAVCIGDHQVFGNVVQSECQRYTIQYADLLACDLRRGRGDF